MTFMKSLSLVLFALLAASTMSSACADNARELRQREVRYGDLDLTQTRDALKLYSRIHSAANSVCRTSGLIEVMARPRMKRCAAQALARAVADVDAPLLSDYYLARNPGSPLPIRTADTDVSRSQARTLLLADRFASNELAR
jgi:UrcA family protein